MNRGLNQFGRVAQLGEHLLCKHVFISSKSLNRRHLTVQNPLLVGLLIGLQILKNTLSKFGQTLTNGLDSSRTVIHLKHGGPEARKSIRVVPLRAARGCFE
jgi:hypothetical protein